MRILAILILSIFFVSLRIQMVAAQSANWGASNLYASAESLPVMGGNDEKGKVHYIIAGSEISISIDQTDIMILDDAAVKENKLVLDNKEPEEGTVLRIFNGDDESIHFEGLSLAPNHESFVLCLLGEWHEAFYTQNGWEVLPKDAK